MVIGNSLSFCVADIISGLVDESDVALIIAWTCATSAQEWEQVLSNCARRHWVKNPEMGKAVARRLMAAGKISQPRVVGCMPPEQDTWVSIST